MLLNIDVAANRLQIKNHGCSPHPEFIFPSQDQKHQFSTEAVSCAETKGEMKVIVFTLKTGQISLRWFLFAFILSNHFDSGKLFPNSTVLEHLLYFS